MNIELLSSLLNRLMISHDRVTLPGMGSFISEVAPAYFSSAGMVINPPYRRILFRSKELWDDKILTNEYAKERGVAVASAESEIEQYVEWLKLQLRNNGHFKFPNFGTIRATTDNDFFFVAQQGIFNYIEAYGLEPVPVKKLSTLGNIERLKKRRVRNFFKHPPIFPTLTDVEDLFADLDNGALQHEEIEEVESLDQNMVEQYKKQFEAVERVEGGSNLVEAEGGNVSDSDLIEAEEGNVSDSDFVEADESVEGEREQIEPKEGELSVEVVKSRRESSLISKVIIILSIIFLLLLLVILLHHYREELQPFLEKILYSREERELLKLL